MEWRKCFQTILLARIAPCFSACHIYRRYMFSCCTWELFSIKTYHELYTEISLTECSHVYSSYCLLLRKLVKLLLDVDRLFKGTRILCSLSKSRQSAKSGAFCSHPSRLSWTSVLGDCSSFATRTSSKVGKVMHCGTKDTYSSCSRLVLKTAPYWPGLK